MVSDLSDKTFDTLCEYKHHIFSGCDKQHICECRANVVRTFYAFSLGFCANYPPIPHESCRIYSRHVCIIVVIICITARANDFDSHRMLFMCERYCALCCTDALKMIVNTFVASHGLWHLPYSISVIAIGFLLNNRLFDVSTVRAQGIIELSLALLCSQILETEVVQII